MNLQVFAMLLLGSAAVTSGSLELAGATYRTIPREYRLDGVVEAINRSTVSAQTNGQVQEILYDVDDFVEKGAVVVRLKDTEHRARVAQAAAELKSAAAQLEQAREEHDRVKGMHAKGLASNSAADKAVADLKSGEARLESATAALQQAREQLAYTEIRAPYAGIVTHRHVEPGEVANPGQPMMSGVSLEELRVIVDVPQSIIPSVRVSGTVRVYLPDGSTVPVDKVTIFPFADLGSNTFKVRLELPRGLAKLFPGMYVKTGFVTGEKRELTVPKRAVVYRSEVTGVYVAGADGRLRFRQVRLGRALDDELVVLAGLDEGEQVALDPTAAAALLKEQAAARRAEAPHGAH